MLLASWKDNVLRMGKTPFRQRRHRVRSRRSRLHKPIYHFNAASRAPTPCSGKQAGDFASPAAVSFAQRRPMPLSVTPPGWITRSVLAPALLNRRPRFRYGPGSGPWTGRIITPWDSGEANRILSTLREEDIWEGMSSSPSGHWAFIPYPGNGTTSG